MGSICVWTIIQLDTCSHIRKEIVIFVSTYNCLSGNTYIIKAVYLNVFGDIRWYIQTLVRWYVATYQRTNRSIYRHAYNHLYLSISIPAPIFFRQRKIENNFHITHWTPCCYLMLLVAFLCVFHHSKCHLFTYLLCIRLAGIRFVATICTCWTGLLWR